MTPAQEQRNHQPDWYRRLSAYQKYLRSDHWLSLRAEKIEASGHCCNRCGSIQDLEVHHLYYAKSWYDCQLADLEVLCEDCHRKAHPRRIPDWARIKSRNFAAFRNPFRGSV